MHSQRADIVCLHETKSQLSGNLIYQFILKYICVCVCVGVSVGFVGWVGDWGCSPFVFLFSFNVKAWAYLCCFHFL